MGAITTKSVPDGAQITVDGESVVIPYDQIYDQIHALELILLAQDEREYRMVERGMIGVDEITGWDEGGI